MISHNGGTKNASVSYLMWHGAGTTNGHDLIQPSTLTLMGPPQHLWLRAWSYSDIPLKLSARKVAHKVQKCCSKPST